MDPHPINTSRVMFKMNVAINRHLTIFGGINLCLNMLYTLNISNGKGVSI